MAHDDDDATRIYRPYGSPPPEDSTPDPSSRTPAADPFAPEPTSTPAADPFAPATGADPFAPAPSADPFAPATATPGTSPAPSDADDPFRADVPALAPSSGTPAADPFAPAPSSKAADDPFAPASPPAADPFAPVDPPAADPFAPSKANSPADDPFAPSTSSDPFAPADPDPFRSDTPAPDPFDSAPAAADPFAASPPPATPPASDPFAPAPSSRTTGGDWDASPADPYAPAPTPGPALGSDRADPFAEKPSTSADDPFAAYKGPAISSGGGLDSGFHQAHDTGVEVEIPKAFGTEESLAGAFTPVFSLILQIRSAQDLGDPTALRQRIEALLSESAQAARRMGANDADVDEATFCLVAFLDEAILASSWHGRDSWSAQPLQLAHYDRNDAGERFFDRLKALLDSGGRLAVLEVYYLCLALGFKGRYAIQGREVLRRLVDDLYTRLSASNQPGALAPRGTSREVAAQAEKAGLPTWALWVGAAVLVALIYLVLSLMLSSAAGDTADELRTLSTQSE